MGGTISSVDPEGPPTGLHLAGASPLPRKCSCISTALQRIIALFIALVRRIPGGISRAAFRAAVALTFSSSASDAKGRLTTNELFA